MEKKKILRVIGAVCDARDVKEATLAGYDEVEIKCALLLVSQASRELLEKYQVKSSAVQTMELEGDVKIATLNGDCEIGPSTVPPRENTFLLVNGKVTLLPGAEEILGRYVGGAFNGKVLCPEGMVGCLSAFQINGKVESYPDGCILLKPTAILDKTFPLRAKEGRRYYASKRIVALDKETDFDALAAKNVGFATPELLVAESLAEKVIPLVDERADITVLPDGTAFVDKNAQLDEALLRRYATKLYVQGALTVKSAGAELLSRLEYLKAAGELLVTRAVEEKLRSLDKIEYKTLSIVGGTVLTDRPMAVVDRAILEAAVEGLSISDCATVRFAPDIPAELIRERVVSITDCAVVSCTPEQRWAIELVAQDVAVIDDSGKGLRKGLRTLLDRSVLRGVGRLLEDEEMDETEGMDGTAPDRPEVKRMMGTICKL